MADLDVVATSPLGQELPLQVTPLNDGAEMVEFSPSVPGTYMINITYGKTNIYVHLLKIFNLFEKYFSCIFLFRWMSCTR